MTAAASVGLSETEFWACTPRYLWHLVKAKEDQIKTAWEQARLSGYLALAARLDHPERTSPKGVYPFPWEKQAVNELAEAWENFDPEILERERLRTEEELARRRALKAAQKTT